MIITLFEAVYLSNVDGATSFRSHLFPTFEEAKEWFDKKVQEDINDIRECHELYKEDDPNKEDGEYVYELSETEYTSWEDGDYAMTFVTIFIKEHTVEIPARVEEVKA